MRFLRLAALVVVVGSIAACQPSAMGTADELDTAYCAVATPGSRVEVVRPGPDEPPVDDVNWFARPVPNASGDWIIGFASHDQNYFYNLSTGARIKIPDRSDAVATPDGRYLTVPSNYTPDEYIRFYDALELLEYLDRGEDADGVPPVYIHEHADLRKVYYQSTGVLSTTGTETVYRLMFSGTRSESGFRIVDYRFSTDEDGELVVQPTKPMKLCPEIPNDLNTPFISKDARYVVSYTSSSPESAYSPGSSLKLYRIVATRPEEGTTACEEVIDFGFAAGKADFSYDNSKLTFHISQGGYLTPFINGGLQSPTVTDVVVVNLEQNASGDITGHSRMARVTTSLEEGIGSYFPAFLPDGNLFYIFNSTPKESESEKRFSFKVVDPSAEATMANLFADEAATSAARVIGALWQSACRPSSEAELQEHEAPWVVASLSPAQCRALVEERWSEELPPKETLVGVCAARP